MSEFSLNTLQSIAVHVRGLNADVDPAVEVPIRDVPVWALAAGAPADTLIAPAPTGLSCVFTPGVDVGLINFTVTSSGITEVFSLDIAAVPVTKLVVSADAPVAKGA